jgi:hypothetical protein
MFSQGWKAFLNVERIHEKALVNEMKTLAGK